MHNLSSVGFDSKATKAMGRTMEDNINGAKCAGCWLIVVGILMLPVRPKRLHIAHASH